MGTSIDDFRASLGGGDDSRREIGIELSDAEAGRLLSDPDALGAYYARWLALHSYLASDETDRPAQEGEGAHVHAGGDGDDSPADPPTTKPQRGIGALWIGTTALILAAGGVAAGAVAYSLQASELARLERLVADAADADTNQDARLSSVADRLADVEGTLADDAAWTLDVKSVYDEVLPSIVTVHCASGLGTGFAYDAQAPDGYKTTIITNNHVIEECTYSDAGRTVRMVKADGTEISGYVWGWDTTNDLATIGTTAQLPTLSDASAADIGDPAIAVGSPQGLSNTVTQGIISNVYSDAYQTDAAINHGNSGGPLLDRQGRVLGVTTFALDREGLNIAVRTVQFCEEILACP